MVQTLERRSISDRRAPTTSPDRPAVRIRNQRTGANRLPLAQQSRERGHVAKRHRPLMAANELSALRQEMIQLAAPSRRVLAGAEALGLGRVQNRLNAASSLLRGLRCRRPDRLERLQHRIRIDEINADRPQVRREDLERSVPIADRLLPSERCGPDRSHFVGHLAEGWDSRQGPAGLDRVRARPKRLAGGLSLLARRSDRSPQETA